jgi:hypothetical protein
VSGLRLARNAWSGAAAALVAAALPALVLVLTDPYTPADTKILFSLGALVLGFAAFFSGLALVDRGGALLGGAAVIASPAALIVLLYAIWQDALSSSDAETELWIGVLTLIAILFAVTSRLQAPRRPVAWVSAASGGFAALAGIVSLAAAIDHAQFWRVGTTITTLWTVAALLLFLAPTLERARSRSVLWLAPAIALVGAAVTGIGALLIGPFAPQGYLIFFTLVATVATCATLLAGLVAIERGAHMLGLIAAIASPLALVLSAHGIWHAGDDRFSRISTGVVLVIALSVALSARLFAASRLPMHLAAGAAAASCVAAVISLRAIWEDRFFVGEKSTTTLWIVATLLCLLVPLLERCLVATSPPVESPAQPASG